MTVYGAKVKSALSGDTVVLTPVKPPQQGKPPSERILSLAYVSAPRLRRDEGDEPHAFQSREYLRLLLVGKEVRFEVLYTVPSTGREYGVVYLGGTDSVNERLISEGIVRVRASSPKDAEPNDLTAKYLELEQAAKDANASIWSTSDNASYSSYYELPIDFVDKYKGQTIDSIVERIINGDRAIVRLILPDSHVIVPVLVAGIRAPRSSQTHAAAEQHGEPYGDVAKYFVEARLLQRNVKIEVLGQSQQGVLIGQVIHPAGIIAEKLLESGLATVSDWQSNFVGAANMSKLRAAEATAKAKGFNIWHGTVVTTTQAHAADAENDKLFTAVVSRVVSADTLVVRTKSSGDRTVQLASVRGPRQADQTQASYVAAAREFVRKRTIGKHVKVTFLHTRPKSENFDARDIVTITLIKTGNNDGIDLASLLVENGYASVIRHRKGEFEDRSPIWDELLEKESAAIAEKKAIHSGIILPPDRTVNASESNARATAFLPSLQRQKRIPAIVEFVNTGSRLRLLLPRENARIKFILAGIQTPRVALASGTGSEKSEPFGEEAKEFTSRRLLQRDVEIDVTHADKSGGFFGLVHVPGNKDTFALSLLEEGLATIDEYSAQSAAAPLSAFTAAQELAQEKRKGLWKDYKAKQAAPPTEVVLSVGSTTTQSKKKEYLNVAVTNVASDGTFDFIILDDKVAKLKQFTASLSAAINTASPVTGRLRLGDLVAYALPRLSSYGRFKVTQYDHASKSATLTSLDFGIIIDEAPLSKLKVLPAGFAPNASIPVSTKLGRLSIVRYPEFSDDYLYYAVSTFADIALSEVETILSGQLKKLIAIVDGPVADGLPGAVAVTLFDASDIDKSINERLANEGWVYVPSDKVLRRGFERSSIGSTEVANLRKKVDQAKIERKGIWEYGDVTPDDE
ncbi:hypothetical protein V1514DRAFT_326729 [Lipomyces japonicus]|uniref:uncharacterized protein n=1 Tax=Lipomyces japonicus TaxID=56871 RepID=UPI0034CE52F7